MAILFVLCLSLIYRISHTLFTYFMFVFCRIFAVQEGKEDLKKFYEATTENVGEVQVSDFSRSYVEI